MDPQERTFPGIVVIGGEGLVGWWMCIAWGGLWCLGLGRWMGCCLVVGGERGMGEFKIERIHILSSHFICQVTTFLRDNATCDNIRTISEYNATPDNLLALRHCCVIAKIVGSAQLCLF